MRIKPTYIIIFILILIIILLQKCNSNTIENLKSEVNKEVLKNDKLRVDKDGIYRKYVADSLTKKQLKRKVKDLEIKSKDPVIVEKIVFRPVTIEKEPDTVYISGDTIKVKDYYPAKEDPFIEYTLNVEGDKKSSKFDFVKDIQIGLVIEETDKGLLETKIKAPDFIKLGQVDVHMLPEDKPQKPDNFGILVGGGVGQDYLNDTKYLKLGTGLRYKKVYLQVQATTNQSVDLTLSYEF